MITASGEIINRDEVNANTHIFYVILIKNILRTGRGAFSVKIGKSRTGRERLLSYERTYGVKGFEILMLRKFAVKSAHGFDVTGNNDIRQSWVDKFESHVIRELKDMKVIPMYVRENREQAQSSEYYYPEDLEKVMEAVMNVINKLNVEVKPKKNKKSARIAKQKKPAPVDYALRSREPVVVTPPVEKPRTRRYQGLDRYDFKNDYVPK